MTNQLTLPETRPELVVRRELSRLEALEIARTRVLNPTSKNTQRAYEQAFARWTRYCDDEGLPWAPIDAAELVGYLEKLTRTHAPNTVRLHLSALVQLDQASRITPTDPYPQSLREHYLVQKWEQSWSRDNPRAPLKRAPALERSHLERLLEAIAEPPKGTARAGHVLRAVRDRCLVLFGVHGALRANDLARLRFEQIEQRERGIALRIVGSKTDKKGEGDVVGLMPQGRTAFCPIDAFSRWRMLRGEAPGAVFAGITRGGELAAAALSERQITRLVHDYGVRAGLELSISAHSMRATLATRASEAGKPAANIMQHGRWRSAEVFSGYIRNGELFNNNVTAGLFD